MKTADESVLREILEQTLAGYWDWDIPSGDEYLSPTFKKMFGYEDNEIPNRAESWQKQIFAEDLPKVHETFRKHADSKGVIPYYNEVRYRHKNGSTVWVACTGKVITWDDDGNPLRMVGCHIDITARKKAEQEHHDIAMRQEATLAAVPDIIAEVDNNKVYTWMNDAGLKFFGENAVGKEAESFFEGHQDTYSVVQPLFNGDPNIIYVESWQRRHDGAKRLLAWWCRVLKDINGNVTGALSTARDITDLRKAEEALMEEKERLAVTLRSIGDAVIATDKNGNIMLMNKVAEDLTGFRFYEVAQKPLVTAFTIINEVTRQPCDNPVDIVLQNNRVVGLANHSVLVRRDGSEISITDSGAPIINNDGSIIGVVLVFRDITEKAKVERALQNVQKLESLGILAAGIAHDFNNLLSGIYGNIDMAVEETERRNVKKYLRKALGTIDRARALTGQLLTFAKGGAPIKKLGSLVPFVEETTKFALSGSNVSSRFSIRKNLWQCEFDSNQIGQVIDNIVINAQQAMPEGGTVEITAENIQMSAESHATLPGGDYVKIAFKDHGIGIPREILPKIFDPFFTTKTRGQGLGLATSYSIVNRHDGCIEVESEPGKGSTFTIYLPASLGTASSPISSTMSIHHGTGLVLVMDDEEVVRDTVGSMLKAMGYEVHYAAYSEEALALFKRKCMENSRFTALILDLTIPGGPGGKETIHEIREIDTDVPAFVASGYTNDPIMANPGAYGFNDSIKKPFRKGELSELLNKHLKKSE